MRAARAVLSLGIALALVGAPALAAPMSRATVAGQLVLDDFATCLVTRQPATVSAYLARFPDGDIDRTTARLGRSDCLTDDSVRLTPMATRGAFYRSLYRLRFGQAAPAAIAPVDYGRDLGGRTGRAAAEYVELRVFAACVVAADPATVHALLRARPASYEESRALTTLAPRFGHCLGSGIKARLSNEVIVGLLAEAAYRGATQTGTGLN